jgi:heme oxygenase
MSAINRSAAEAGRFVTFYNRTEILRISKETPRSRAWNRRGASPLCKLLSPSAASLTGVSWTFSSNEPSRPAAPGLRQQLKEATADTHRELDRAFGAFDLAAVSGYRRFLEASAAALLPLEAILVRAGVEQIIADWPQRSRSTAILDDLRLVDGRCEPLELDGVLSRHGVLGIAYVLEGSRLGAKVMLARLAAEDRQILRATAYLRHGSGLPLWREFLALLARQEPVVPRELAEAIDGARFAFNMFQIAASRA